MQKHDLWIPTLVLLLAASIRAEDFDDPGDDVTFGFHQRMSWHWKGAIKAACAGTTGAQNPLGDQTDMLISEDGFVNAEGDLQEVWVFDAEGASYVVLDHYYTVRGGIIFRVYDKDDNLLATYLEGATDEATPYASGATIYDAADTSPPGVLAAWVKAEGTTGDAYAEAGPGAPHNAGGFAVVQSGIRVHLNLIGRAPGEDGGLEDVPEDEEEAPGVLFVPEHTELEIEEIELQGGELTLNWTNPDPDRQLQLEYPAGEWSDSPITIVTTGNWQKTFQTRTTAAWLPGDSATIRLTHSLLPPEKHDKVKLVPILVRIIDLVPSYYADAESHVPLVFAIEGAALTIADLSDPRVTFSVDGSDYLFSDSVELHSGDFISEDFATDNLFTALIKESAYDSIAVVGDISADVAYSLILRVTVGDNASGDCASGKANAERFGDKTIPIYEIGVSGNGNGVYNLTAQPNHKRPRTRKGTITFNGTVVDLPWSVVKFSTIYYGKSIDEAAKYRLKIKYDTEPSPPVNNSPLRFSLADERRQGYAMVYHPRKSIGDIADIVDLSKNNTHVRMKAFRNVENYFTYEWGQPKVGIAYPYKIESEADFPNSVIYALGIVDTALAAYGLVSGWNPTGWAALLASASIGLGDGVAGAITGSTGMGGEWACVTMYGGYVIRDKDGNKTGEGWWPSSDADKIQKRLAPDGVDSHGKNHHENFTIDTYTGQEPVYVGSLYSVFLSGSIEASSPAGVVPTFPVPQDFDIQLALELDISDDPTIYLWE